MYHFLSQISIQEDIEEGGRYQTHDPLHQLKTKPKGFQHLVHVLPTQFVIVFRNIKFDHHAHSTSAFHGVYHFMD